ncbi:MAG: inorganic phosphate transporter [Angelakisella sp.]
MISLWSVVSGGFLGWSLGANDAANVFGTAVTTRVIKYSTAITLCSVFVIIGALANGSAGIHNLSSYAYNSGVDTAWATFWVMLSAGATVTAMTFLSFPVSTSQCVIGSIIGWGLAFGRADFSATTKFFSAWIITPVGACAICFVLCWLTQRYLQDKIHNLAGYDMIIKWGYYISGIFGAYSLGANNVANVTALYAGELNLLSDTAAELIGGITIALGVLTFSKRVMFTVGSKITELSALTGFLVTFACALTVFIYALIGIPVSTSQAVVGAVIGAGLVKGIQNVDFKVLRNIFVAWFGTPTIAGCLSFALGIIMV